MYIFNNSRSMGLKLGMSLRVTRVRAPQSERCDPIHVRACRYYGITFRFYA